MTLIAFKFQAIILKMCAFFCRVYDVLEMVKSVDAMHENVLKTLLTYIYSLCVGFGTYITRSKVYKYAFL